MSAVCGNYSFKNLIMMKTKKNLEDMWLKWIALFYFELRDRIECFVCWERVGLYGETEDKGRIINATEEVRRQEMDLENSWRDLPWKKRRSPLLEPRVQEVRAGREREHCVGGEFWELLFSQ